MTQSSRTSDAPTDRVYAEPMDDIAGFSFDDNVAAVFPDMIERSVPGYATVVGMSGVLAARYARPGSRLYDLGCSLGATSLSMARAVREPGCRIVAVDSSKAMTGRLQTLLSREAPSTPIEVVCDDILRVELADASVVALNYTLQFIPVAGRGALLERIRGAMKPGGVLILSEKIRLDDDAMNAFFIDLHEEFKRRRGYSELEISQKRTALENVLVPETIGAHRERLAAARFARVEVWFQCFNFASLVAFA
jgi:tRNA (cmo5U34)-methyltransferase